MITKIEVKELYGAFDHPIKLKEENITMILGENGLGKTVILKMIKAFFDKDFFELQTYLFKEFILTFSNNDVVSIEKEINDNGCALKFSHHTTTGKKKPETYIMSFSENQRPIHRLRRNRDLYYHDEIHYEIGRYLPFPIEKVGPDTWLNSHEGELFSTQQLFERYGEFLPANIRKQFESLPDWLVKKSSSIKTKFIETQRLLIRTKAQEQEYKSSVVNYSQGLIEKIKNKTVAATDLASKLDRSYPNRVINQITHPKKILIKN
ncbi:hypothetical protein [Flavobacterium sp. N3904]|uniref:hypothetical protein n=1 Tax=Flavobacterium sp. N3904 TaxID=2986835 RepID=UPI002224416E|nr:hypothetical protein [Flavobacterium sp. N3904]